MEFLNFDTYTKEFMADHVFNMNTLGYNVIESFFTDEESAYLRQKLENAISEYIPFDASERSKLDKYHMHDLLCKDLAFGKTLEDPRIQQLIAAQLGEYWIMYAYTSSSLPPKGNNYGSRMHVDSPRLIPNYPTNLGIIWALDDFTLDNGATYVLPGSHNTDLIPSEELFKKQSIRLTCKKGSIIVLNARMWHAAGVNNTDSFRHALTINVCRPYMKQRMDWVRFIPNSIANQLNQQAKRIIGYDTRIPTNLDEFFQPEENRFYKGGQE
jgi:ectoine hydroxylase-related dioxygenase (phytanoyl-CoA dioxygenase family)